MAFKINKNLVDGAKSCAFTYGKTSKTVSLSGEKYTYKNIKGVEITVEPPTQEDLAHMHKLGVKYVEEVVNEDSANVAVKGSPKA